MTVFVVQNWRISAVICDTKLISWTIYKQILYVRWLQYRLVWGHIYREFTCKRWVHSYPVRPCHTMFHTFSQNILHRNRVKIVFPSTAIRSLSLGVFRESHCTCFSDWNTWVPYSKVISPILFSNKCLFSNFFNNLFFIWVLDLPRFCKLWLDNDSFFIWKTTYKFTLFFIDEF